MCLNTIAHEYSGGGDTLVDARIVLVVVYTGGGGHRGARIRTLVGLAR